MGRTKKQKPLVNSYGWPEYKCPMCGKLFIGREDWGYQGCYKNEKRKFCSYSCMRKHEKENDQPKRRHFVKAVEL